MVVLIIYTLLLPLSMAFLMFDRVNDENDCLLAMCDADSGCVPIGCSVDQFNRIGCGYFRLNIYHYRQCFQPGRGEDDSEEQAWMNCSHNYECSAQCIKTLANKFRVKCYGKSDCESMARIHDGGANGCRDSSTVGYWKSVLARCEGKCDKPFLKRY